METDKVWNSGGTESKRRLSAHRTSPNGHTVYTFHAQLLHACVKKDGKEQTTFVPLKKEFNFLGRLRSRTSKMQYFFALFIAACVLIGQGAVAFNLDVNFPRIVTIPEKKSYFGYSVDMYAGPSESWLLVGAPKSNTRGEVYMCKYAEGQPEACSRVDITKEEPASGLIRDMLGMTMKLGQGKQLLACAPYFTQQSVVNINSDQIIYYDMLGICYLAADFTASPTNVFNLKPCQSAKGAFHDGDEHGNCEAGFSAAFTKDREQLLLGTAGSFYRQGAIMLVPLPPVEDYSKKLPIHTAEFKPVIPSGWKEADYLMQSYDDNYLGYSVATGKSPGNSQLLFVSAPRRFGYDLLGMVVVYDDSMNNALYNLTGTQTGEYFGCGLAAVDLNNDNLDDVIVGAPLYSDFARKKFENGRVYVFYQQKGRQDPDGPTSLQFSEPIIIEGKENRARFGHVVSSIGDINQDGYQDIAVGAPYSSNSEDAASDAVDGSVFIYNGGPEGIGIPASQEIKGMTLDGSMAGFGISISGEKDVDGNGYPDVMAGAYISDQAVLLRARPVVGIESNVRVDPQTIEIEEKSCKKPALAVKTTCFEVITCFSYVGKKLPPSIVVTYTYDIDSGMVGDEKRAFVVDDSPRNVTLTRKTEDKSKEECVKEFAYLKVDVRDKLSEIKVNVSYSLVTLDEAVQPVLNQLKPTYSTANVKIFKDCGADDICQADLRVKSSLDQEAVYVGQEWPIVLRDVVTNMGEPAFLTSLVVEFPDTVYYVGIQDKKPSSGIVPYCSNLDRYVTCELANPMKRDAMADVNLKFRVTGLTGNVSQLVFKSFANSTNAFNNTSEMALSPLRIGVKSNVIIYNTSSPDTIFLGDTSSKEDQKKKVGRNLTSVLHVYELINNGPSDIEAGTIRIDWPMRTREGKMPLLELVEIVETASVSCDPIKKREKREAEKQTNSSSDANYYHCGSGAECFTVICHVGTLRRQEEISLTVHSSLPLSTVLANDLDSYIRSDFQFTIDEFPYDIDPGPVSPITSEVTTKCLYVREPKPKEIQWWIIAIAVAAGVLVLVLLIFALWRCGFFKRKRKPESEDDRSQREQLNPKGGVEDDEKEMEQYLK